MIKIYQKDLATMKKIVMDYTEQVVDLKIEAAVQEIISTVKKTGDQALINYAKQFDQVDITDLKVADEDLTQAWE